MPSISKNQKLVAEADAEAIWSLLKKTVIRDGRVKVILFDSIADLSKLRNIISQKLPEHYIVESYLRKRGEEKIAKLLSTEAPMSKKLKSGDIGEILATELVNSRHFEFQIPINRLRYKDGREMAMRGDDLLGFRFDTQPLQILKGESKSRENISPDAVKKARTALEKNQGLPDSHTLAFTMQRLFEANEDGKAELIEEYLLEKSLLLSQMTHLIFTFSANDPIKILTEDALIVNKNIIHYSVGLVVPSHQDFIREVYSEATNGRIS